MSDQRIDAVTGLRGFAALLVVYAHMAEKSWLRPDPHFPGEVGVMIFFSLSGFLIAYLYLAKPFSAANVINYSVARFARIAPAYLFVVLMSLLVYTQFDPHFVYAISQSNIFRHIIFSGNVSVFWSIAPEVQFYAIFLLIWILSDRCISQYSVTGLLLLSLLFITLLSYRDVFPGTFVGSKLHFFLFGVIAGFLRRKVTIGKQGTTSLSSLQILLIGLMLAVEMGWISFPYSFKSDFYTSIPCALLSSLLVFSFSLPSPFGKLLFENKAIKLCGDYSFSIYLLNMPIIYLFKSESASPFHLVSMTAASIVVIFIASLGNYHLIEKPGGRMIRSVGKQFEKFWLNSAGTKSDASDLRLESSVGKSMEDPA